MKDICLGFEVHQPYRIRAKLDEKLPLEERYFDNEKNRTILDRVCRKCYLPATQIIRENVEKFESEDKPFKVCFSISGVLLEQLERWRRDVLEAFQQLATSKFVEFLNQTYYHSLTSLFSSEREEFVEQVTMHRTVIKDLFGRRPRVFENTEFIYNNSIAKTVRRLGFEGMLTEGAERILGWRSPNYVYKARDTDLKVLLRNYQLSDDIAFRFTIANWSEYPLTADKYAAWLAATPGECINIFIDFETFGEHHWPETGILEFLRWLPEEVLKRENLRFVTPSELLNRTPVGEIDVFEYATVSWADTDKGIKAWLGNEMQRISYRALKEMEPYVKSLCDPELLRIWRMFGISDNIYYMYTEWGPSGVVHGYFSQMYPTDAFAAFTRSFSDFQALVMEKLNDEKIKLLRIFPPEKAFHFFENNRYVTSVFSLVELYEKVDAIPSSCLRANMRDIEQWIRWTVGDGEIADRIKELHELDLSGEQLRKKVKAVLEEKLRAIKLRGL